MLELNVVSRYSIGKGTPEEIKAFNDFMDLEESRFDYEHWIQREYCHHHGEFQWTDDMYPTFKHP
jgi:hypothetical protein